MHSVIMMLLRYYDGEYVTVARIVCCHFESPLPRTQSDMNYVFLTYCSNHCIFFISNFFCYN